MYFFHQSWSWIIYNWGKIANKKCSRIRPRRTLNCWISGISPCTVWVLQAAALTTVLVNRVWTLYKYCVCLTYWVLTFSFFLLPLLFLAIGNVQHSSSTAKGRNLSAEAYPAVLQPFLGQKGKKGLAHPSLPVHVRNAVLAAALFPEFLKELAALAQEHSVLCYKILGDFEDYY